MKKIYLFVFLCISSFAFSQHSFGVSPGIGFNSAYWGFKQNEKLILFVGFQYFNANYNSTIKGFEYDYNVNKIIPFSDTDFSTVNVYVPNKYIFHEPSNTISISVNIK